MTLGSITLREVKGARLRPNVNRYEISCLRLYFHPAKFDNFKYEKKSDKKTGCWVLIMRLYFHPAKFDNFKDEKMSDYKTVSIVQSKNLLD